MALRSKEFPSHPLFVALFSASWSPPSKQMEVVFDKLATQHQHLPFFVFDADESPALAAQHKVSAVPCFLFFKNGKVADRLEGASAPKLVQKVGQFAKDNGPTSESGSASAPGTPSPLELQSRLKALVNRAPVMLFMKGTPEEAKCKFSRKAIEILKDESIEFSSFDILADPAVREGLKEFSNWPTYPQLYINGALVGGVDILTQLKEDGELQQMVAKAKPKGLEDRLKELINSAPIMLFMKGHPDEPKCGFSRKVVELLRTNGAQFGHFDILTDNEVREGLKKYSNWPTYPQVYAKGSLVGGLDVLKELEEEGELKSALGVKSLDERLKELTHSSPVMLFMKGAPSDPKCGFSRKMVELLQRNQIQFGSFDILTDNEVREGLKKYSNWPTYPQVYSQGKLVGGLDVLKELEEEGELVSSLVP